MKRWNVILSILVAAFVFGAALAPNAAAQAGTTTSSRTIFTVSMDKTSLKPGDTVTITMSCSAGPNEQQPLDVHVAIPNPLPASLKIDQTSITGGGTYVASIGGTGPEGVVWDGTLTPGSLPYTVTFKMTVKSAPSLSLSGYPAVLHATLIDASQAGSLPETSATANFTIFPITMYFPIIGR